MTVAVVQTAAYDGSCFERLHRLASLYKDDVASAVSSLLLCDLDSFLD